MPQGADRCSQRTARMGTPFCVSRWISRMWKTTSSLPTASTSTMCASQARCQLKALLDGKVTIRHARTTPCMRKQVDLDLGSSGAIPIKGKYVITGGKQGPLYIVDAMNLGGFKPSANNTNVFQVRIFPALPTSCRFWFFLKSAAWL